MSKAESKQSKIDIVRELIFGEEMEKLVEEIQVLQADLASMKTDVQKTLDEFRESLKGFKSDSNASIKDLRKQLDKSQQESLKSFEVLEGRLEAANAQFSGEGAKKEELAALFIKMAAHLQEGGTNSVADGELRSIENE